MVPLEADPPDSGTGSTSLGMGRVFTDGTSRSIAGASAPLGVITKLALKDAVLELEATVRRTRDVSSIAVMQLWQSAERKLGFEVGIDDPALRDLFGVHVLAVEELISRVRAQAESALAAADVFGEVQLFPTAAVLRPLCHVPMPDVSCNGGSGASVGGPRSVAPIQALEAELLDADQAVIVARERLESRVRSEVLDVLDLRLATHEAIREDVRERHKAYATAERLRRDVAWLKKGSSGSSGLRALSGRSASGTLDEAENRLREAMQTVNDLDVQMLSRLLELETGSVDAVRQPWASLLQIQAEYFLAQQAAWSHLGGAFQEFAGSPPPTKPLPLATPMAAAQ